MLNDKYHSSAFVGRRLCKLIVLRGLVIEVKITVFGPSGALWKWIYRCSLIGLMTSGRYARACDAVVEQGCAGMQAEVPPWNFKAEGLGLWV